MKNFPQPDASCANTFPTQVSATQLILFCFCKDYKTRYALF